MNDMNYIGVDNGVSGAIALLSSLSTIIAKIPMPIQKTRKGNEVDIMEVKMFLRNSSPDFFTFVIEEPGGSKSARSASSMANCFGSLRALAVLMGYRLVRVTPQQWQKAMLKCKSGDTKPASIATARQLWPKEDWRPTTKCKVPSDALTDAALIAEYARRSNM